MGHGSHTLHSQPTRAAYLGPLLSPRMKGHCDATQKLFLVLQEGLGVEHFLYFEILLQTFRELCLGRATLWLNSAPESADRRSGH